jgi:hypothetical protein
MAMWESLRGYVCALLAGAIFVACQALSGGAPGGRADGAGVEPGDRSYRAETMGRSRADRAPLTATSLYAESSTGVQTD